MIRLHHREMQLALWVASCASLSSLGCVRPADERLALDEEVGDNSVPGLALQVDDGQASIRQLDAGESRLWAQAPVLDIFFTASDERDHTLQVDNCMPDAVATLNDIGVTVSHPRPTQCVILLNLPEGESRLHLAPPDELEDTAYRFADMGDIQTAMDSVDEVFAAISATPDLRFLMSTGDVAEDGTEPEYDLYERQLLALNIPIYSTVGNHDLTDDATNWHRRYGRFNVHFRFKGVDFSFLDSGNASMDADLLRLLDTWLDEGRDRVHIFGTHYPPLDPVGIRHAGFRSRNEAAKLLAQLARGNVDLTIYGHIHSYYEFENAGIPAVISGGGGALPEKLDGIDRHFLVIEVDPNAGVLSVEPVEVD